jgi:hypothetical protein
MMASYSTFSDADCTALEPEMKVGLLATVNPQGLPHLTLISTLRPNGPREVIWGQFAEGLSKENIVQNPQAGFLMMTLDRSMWRGKARFTHTANTGPEFELFNSQPMWRYNAYFGIHRVYYMDLVEQYGREPLPMGRIVQAALATMAARLLAPAPRGREVLNPWTRRLLDKIDHLKFVSYVGEDGYPVVVPAIQSETAGPDQVIFSTAAFGEELRRIPAGAPLALFGMSFQMQDVLLRGTYRGIARRAGFPCGALDVDWVYSPMPPKPGQVYPPVPLEAVTRFK